MRAIPRFGDAGSGASDLVRAAFLEAERDVASDTELASLAGRLEPLFSPGALPGAPSNDPSPIGWVARPSGIGWTKLAVVASVVGVLAGGAAFTALDRGPRSVAGLERVRLSIPVPRPSPSTEAHVAAAERSSDPPQRAQTRARAVVAGAPVRTQEASTPSPSDRKSELLLLQQARAALVTDPQRALALTNEHRRRFPNGVLEQEREVIAIEASKRSGDQRAAHERASRFRERYPNSAHGARVEATTGSSSDGRVKP